MDKKGILDTGLLDHIIKNRESLFNGVDTRISEREACDFKNKVLTEYVEVLTRRKNTEKVANGIIMLINQVLTEANQKKAYLDITKIDPALGVPYNGSHGIIGNEGASYYSFDDEGLTIVLNYSYKMFELNMWGGKSFIYNEAIPVDESYLEELLEQGGIEYNRYCSRISDYAASETHIDIITIKFKKHVKEKNKTV